jgi:Iap family predicted aminopeptidase
MAPQTLLNMSTPSLEKFARQVAEKVKVQIATATVDIVSADSLSFIEKGIPAISLHGLSANWQNIIHTNRDTADQINPASVYLGYVLALNLLSKIDNCDCNTFR